MEWILCSWVKLVTTLSTDSNGIIQTWEDKFVGEMKTEDKGVKVVYSPQSSLWDCRIGWRHFSCRRMLWKRTARSVESRTLCLGYAPWEANSTQVNMIRHYEGLPSSVTGHNSFDEEERMITDAWVAWLTLSLIPEHKWKAPRFPPLP